MNSGINMLPTSTDGTMHGLGSHKIKIIHLKSATCICTMATKQRRLLEQEILPMLSDETGRVLEVGVYRDGIYRRYFPQAAEYHTLDIDECKHPTIHADICNAWYMLPNAYKVILFNGVYEQLDRPLLALPHLYGLLHWEGRLLLGAPWKMNCYGRKDKWRITPAGVRAYLERFIIEREWNVDDQYLYALARKG